jgi:hypothetical protein
VTKIPEHIICPFSDLVLLLVKLVYFWFAKFFNFTPEYAAKMLHIYLLHLPRATAAAVVFFVIPCFLQWEAALAVEGFLLVN